MTFKRCLSIVLIHELPVKSRKVMLHYVIFQGCYGRDAFGSRKFEVGDAFESTELAIFTLLCLADFYL